MVTKVSPRPAERDAAAMRRRILDAVGEMIVRDGLKSIGVNALARAAGCDKVLIYRYFGDLEGVLEEFAEACDFWWTVEELTAGLDPRGQPPAGALQILLRRHAEAIRARPVTLAVLASELTERVPLVTALEAVRERRSLELAAWISARFEIAPSVDFAAISMLLGVAVNYLAARARDIAVMSGVGIRTDDDWERLYKALDALIEGALGTS